MYYFLIILFVCVCSSSSHHPPFARHFTSLLKFLPPHRPPISNLFPIIVHGMWDVGWDGLSGQQVRTLVLLTLFGQVAGYLPR